MQAPVATRRWLPAGIGFSSTWSRTHNDHEGQPVPSRHATREELLDLCAVVREHPGTTLEFIPGVAPFGDELFDVMAAMSRTANRPLNWNVLQVYSRNAELVEHQLAGSDLAADRGGQVVALTLPDSLRTWLNFRSGFILDILPGWERLMALPAGREAGLPGRRRQPGRVGPAGPDGGGADPLDRQLVHLSHRREHPIRPSWAAPSERSPPNGASRPGTPWPTSSWPTGLNTVISAPDRGQDDASWAKRVEVWRDPSAVVGASDAGAHLDMIDSF